VKAVIYVVLVGCCFTLNAHAWNFDDADEGEDLAHGTRDTASNSYGERDMKLLNMLMRVARSRLEDRSSLSSKDGPLQSALTKERFVNVFKRQRQCFWSVISCY
ncbi:hypothetical protein Bpfe_013793, partial [Biomphalaria pfeifferi]